MSRHLEREIESLKKKILSLCAMVEEAVWHAVKSIELKESALAQSVISGDIKIDHMEVEVEEECLKLLALHQPVAVDLRFIVAVLKINNDLERIGDLAVNIAERSNFLATRQQINFPFDFSDMGRKVQNMLKWSLDALVNLDTGLATQVCEADDEVDDINRQMYDQVKQGIQERPEDADYLIHLLSTSRHLERIADLTTNIAEDVIYMVNGEIVRHRSEDYTAR